MTNEEFIKSISLKGEEWRDVIGYENLYMISSHGRCISLRRMISDTNNVSKIIEPKLISFTMLPSGYLQYKLWLENKEKHKYIHRIVAEAFIPNPDNYPEVDHIDTNKTNNCVANLQWCTSSMNHLNPITRKRNSNSKKGIFVHCTKPVVRIHPDNPLDTKFYISTMETQRVDGYNSSKVAAVCRGERKSHKGYKWMFKSDYETLINKSKNNSLSQ